MRNRSSERAALHLSQRERSNCDSNSGEGFRTIEGAYALTRRYAPTSPHGRGGTERAAPDNLHHPPMLMSSSSEDDTEGTCSPSDAREIATRVLLKAVSAPAWAARLLSSSDISTL